METQIIFISIFFVIQACLNLWFYFRLNLYISKLENEIDENNLKTMNLQKVLESAIKEDYLDKEEGLKVKKPRVSKKEM